MVRFNHPSLFSLTLRGFFDQTDGLFSGYNFGFGELLLCFGLNKTAMFVIDRASLLAIVSASLFPVDPTLAFKKSGEAIAEGSTSSIDDEEWKDGSDHSNEDKSNDEDYEQINDGFSLEDFVS
ncbi:hypothetical protein NE237_016643 [Protea cynaroides]|uniref:Uncharacterized protein n=1 Tax=Protea cynaroides TaxID=273540 RepID=A0A9Q0HIU9_9MAGN|nr:hypothetical protein NE237_016643 [Protea cynaroides]